VNKYLRERGDERIKDWASWVANAKWKVSPASWFCKCGGRAGPSCASGAISYLKMNTVLRLVVLKVMHENGIDLFVNPSRRCLLPDWLSR